MKFLAVSVVALLFPLVLQLVVGQESKSKDPIPAAKANSTGASPSISTQSMLNKLLEDIDVEESRMKRGYGHGGGGGHGHGPGRGGGAAGPIYFCGYVGSKEGYGGYGK